VTLEKCRDISTFHGFRRTLMPQHHGQAYPKSDNANQEAPAIEALHCLALPHLTMGK
jgi:hypothetical protein